MYATTLSYPCPICGEGLFEQDVDTDGSELGGPVPTESCQGTAACRDAFVDSRHGDAVDAAWRKYCDQDFSEAMERRYADGGGSGDQLHAMQQAQRLK
jgi:hypothetical protein